MGLRAVVFDLGMVLTGKPDAEAHAQMLRITGFDAARFDSLYWAGRHAYDEGKVTGIGFWQEFVRNAELSLPRSAIEELNQWDARMWATVNPAMVAWQQQLKQRGLLTAVLSNIGDAVLENLVREFQWLDRFDTLVWSYQLGVAKPDPAIYRHVLKELGAAAAETLFIDDRPVNVATANALGMKGLVFSTVEQLRSDLIMAGLNAELPLP